MHQHTHAESIIYLGSALSIQQLIFKSIFCVIAKPCLSIILGLLHILPISKPRKSRLTPKFNIIGRVILSWFSIFWLAATHVPYLIYHHLHVGNSYTLYNKAFYLILHASTKTRNFVSASAIQHFTWLIAVFLPPLSHQGIHQSTITWYALIQWPRTHPQST